MPKHLSQEFVDSDDDRSSSPRVDRAATGKGKTNEARGPLISSSAPLSQKSKREESGAESSSEDKPLSKKAKNGSDKAKKAVQALPSSKTAKKRTKEDASDGEDPPSPRTAKRKVGASAKYGGKAAVEHNDQGDTYVDLAPLRRVTVRKFKGKTLIDIREFYNGDKGVAPGKKGISLSVEQWDRLKKAVSTVDELIDELA
ncbi:transcription coactivator [Rhodotorula toruloides]|uniref:Transcription coactivator n=1 Tax=Rhodotorula toruloides TaxID=5286 RepID=A0A511KHN8_RHOTO|nr:transcription coactivator [Rhodotorula toruloides]